ncbi:MAG: hypothetical protein ACI9FD_003998 [Gammaproteobacteria bacterium]|jgi:hypothetical protein
MTPAKSLIIACGALSHELVELIRINQWAHIDLTCLPAYWHHTPEKIPEGLRKKIKQSRDKYSKIFVMYGDCGTWGQIDSVCSEEGAERIEGPHCFSFLMGNDEFEKYTDDNITTFYLTDFFCEYFEKFVWQALGLDRRDDMVEFVFGNYKKVVYLAQTDNAKMRARAVEIATKLNLEYEYRYTGYGDMKVAMASIPVSEILNPLTSPQEA